MRIFIIGHISPDLDSVASTLEYKEYLEKIKRYEGAELVAVTAGEPNKEIKFVFKKYGIEIPKQISDFEVTPEDSFILVDHNEDTQRSPKVIDNNVIEIVDHHKINISFTTPIRIDVRPVGSTSTIIYAHFEALGKRPTKGLSGLILDSIISDTVGLKASTTTGIDDMIAKQICYENEWDFDNEVFELFKAKSDISGMTAKDLVESSYKIFDFDGTKVFIGQIETVEPQNVLNQKENIIKELEVSKVTHNVAQAYLFITDILRINSHAMYATEEEGKILEKAFTGVTENGIIDVGAKMSRKKDLAPPIELVLKSL